MNKKALAAECLVIATGIYPEKPVRRMDVEEAIAVPGAAAREISAFMNREDPAKALKTPQIGYLSTWTKLNTRQPTDKELVGVVDDPEIGSGYLKKLAQARDYLKKAWRPSRIMNLTGPQLLPPSVSEEQRCADLYAMVNDSRRIIGRMASGCVLTEEMDALHEVFPLFAKMLETMLRSEIARRSMRRKSYEVPHWQDVAISLYLGEPVASAVETIDKSDKDQTQAPPQQPPQIDIHMEQARHEAMTTADRVQDGSASG